MKLYLVQHGEAVPEEIDPQRPLSPKGRSDVAKMAEFLKSAGLGKIPLLHSGKLRACQTAEILAEAICPGVKPSQRPGIAPNDPVEPLLREISELEGSLMIVGHLPFLSKLASALLSGAESRGLLTFRQGGVACLERTSEAAWRLAWMVAPDILA